MEHLTTFEKIYTPTILEKLKNNLGHEPYKGATYQFLTGKDEGTVLLQRELKRYLDFTEKLGFLDTDLTRRLQSPDFEEFNQAKNEIMAAWFFGERLGFSLDLRPKGNQNHVGEFLLKVENSLGVFVEVKSPFLPVPKEPWAGDDARTVHQNIIRARKQIPKDGRQSIVILCGRLKLPIGFHEANGVFKALYGDMVFRFPELAGTTRSFPIVEWRHDGIFNPRKNTRISAVGILEDSVNSPYYDQYFKFGSFPDKSLPKFKLNYSFAVYHNPYAANPINEMLFRKWKQYVLLPDKSAMDWKIVDQ